MKTAKITFDEELSACIAAYSQMTNTLSAISDVLSGRIFKITGTVEYGYDWNGMDYQYKDLISKDDMTCRVNFVDYKDGKIVVGILLRNKNTHEYDVWPCSSQDVHELGLVKMNGEWK